MRKVLLALSASLLAYPAAAQTEGASGDEQVTGAEATELVETSESATAAAIGCERNLTAAASEPGEATPATQAGSEGELRSTLSEAGFEDVQVLRKSYVMEAIAPNGECLLITVDTGVVGAGMAAEGEPAGEIAARAEGEPLTETDAEVEAAEAGEEPPAGEATAGAEPAEAAEELTMGEDETPVTPQASMGEEPPTADFAESSQQITGDLIDAGYTGVRLVEPAYVVVGRAPDGRDVIMTIRSRETVE